MMNEKNLANTVVETDAPGAKETWSRVSRTGMHACTRGHRCVMERRQEKEAGLHFLCDKCHGQEVRLYSGIMGNHCLTLGFETGNDVIRVKFNSAQHLV